MRQHLRILTYKDFKSTCSVKDSSTLSSQSSTPLKCSLKSITHSNHLQTLSLSIWLMPTLISLKPQWESPWIKERPRMSSLMNQKLIQVTSLWSWDWMVLLLWFCMELELMQVTAQWHWDLMESCISLKVKEATIGLYRLFKGLSILTGLDTPKPLN